MEQLFRRDSSRADSLRMTIQKELIEHMTVRLQPVRPRVGGKELLLFLEILVWPSFNEARNRATPALARPTPRKANNSLAIPDVSANPSLANV
jgi:hypothetical protein